jgi:hypothetical protein
MEAHEIEALQKSNSDMETKLKALESAGGGDKTLQDRNSYLEGEMKKVVEARQKAKDDMKTAEDNALLEKGEFKILAENQAAELAALTSKLAGHEETLGKFKERDEAKLQTLIELIPENLRETVAGNSGTLAEKIDLAEKLATVKPNAPGARPGGDTHTATLQEEYKQAVKDGNVASQIALKRQLFEKKE